MLNKLAVLIVMTGIASFTVAQSFSWTEHFGTDETCGILPAEGFSTLNGTWTVEASGVNGDEHHEWYVGAREAGLNDGECGTGCITDPELVDRTLYISGESFNDIDGAWFEHYADSETDLRAVSPVIDLSAVDFEVSLQFSYILGAHPASSCTVQYYDGESWSDLLEIEETTGDCGSAGEWSTTSITFPPSAMNNPDVRIAFRWVNSGTDDMLFPELSFAVSEIECFASDADSLISDLVISNARYGSYDAAIDSTWKNLEYTEYQYCQVRPLDFSATATNTGTADQTNAYLEVNISDGVGFNQTLTSESTYIAVGDSAQFAIDNYMPPNVPGEYTLTYTIHQDQIDSTLENNFTTRSLKIHTSGFYIYDAPFDEVYPMARDNGIAIASSNNGTGVEFKAGMGFHFTAPAEICCMGAAIMDDSVIDRYFVFQIMDKNFEVIGETEYTLVEMDMFYDSTEMNFTWMPLISPLQLFSETDVVATFADWTESSESIKVGISDYEAPGYSSFVWGEFEDQDSIGWYESDATFMIRLGMSSTFCATAVAEMADHVTGLNLAPNPTAGEVSVEFNLIEKSEVQLFLFDGLGRIVHHEDKGILGTGSYHFEYEWSNLASGMYSLTISSEGKAVSKKLILK